METKLIEFTRTHKSIINQESLKVLIMTSEIMAVQQSYFSNQETIIKTKDGERYEVIGSYEEIKKLIYGKD